MIECHLLKKNTVINKIAPDYMDTLYMLTTRKTYQVYFPIELNN